MKIDSTGTTAVDPEYFWQPIETCPAGVRVQLLGRSGIAMYGVKSKDVSFFTHWAPLPKKPKID